MLDTTKHWTSSLEINQVIRKNGQTSPLESDWVTLNCQGTLIVAIPTVRSVAGCSPVSRRIPFYRDSCCTAWMWYILLNGLLSQQFLSALIEWYQPVAFAYLPEVPVAWTNWISCTQACESAFGWHLLLWNDCWQRQSQIRFCLPW